MKGQSIILRGESGWGKTTLAARTLPGRVLLIETDPSGVDSLEGIDQERITVWRVPQDVLPINVDTRSKTGLRPDSDRETWSDEPQSYPWLHKRFLALWGQHKRPNLDHWTDFDYIVLDTLTGYNQIVAIRYMWIAKRDSVNIMGSDVPMFQGTIAATVGNLVSLSKREDGPTVIFNCHTHVEAPWDAFQFGEAPKKPNPAKEGYKETISAFGAQRRDLYKMVGHSYRLQVFGSGSNLQYKLQTVPPEPWIVGIKTPWKSLPAAVDMTIKDWSQPLNYGWNALFRLASNGQA